MSTYNYTVSFWVDLMEPTPQTHQQLFWANSQRKIRDRGKNNRSVGADPNRTGRSKCGLRWEGSVGLVAGGKPPVEHMNMRGRASPVTDPQLVVHRIRPTTARTPPYCTSTRIFPLFLFPSISSCAARISVHGSTMCTYVFNSPCPSAPVSLPTASRLKRSTRSA
jgi:hypothetical protein